MYVALRVANSLYKNAFSIYRPLYFWYKKRQEAFEIEVLRKNVRSGDVVLDIGANIGFYTELISKLVGSEGKVHCFEPEAENVEHLKDTVRHLANVSVHAKAVGSRNEILKLYISHRFNVDHRTYKPERYDKEVEIEAVALDTYFPPEFKVDVIKMDIQGFEMKALQGMQNLLEKNKNIKIISEFWPYGLKRSGSSSGAYVTFLESLGFTCFLLDNHSLLKLVPEKIQALDLLGEEKYFDIFASRN